MKKRHVNLGITLSLTTLITACSFATNFVPEKQIVEPVTQVISSSNESEQHVYSLDTQVIQTGNSSEPHVYSLDTQVIQTESSSEPHVYSSETIVISSSIISKQSTSKSQLIGRWQGGISMGNHEHPLTFEVKKDQNGGLSASYTYWGMDTRGMGASNEENKSLDFSDKELKFMLPDAGVKFEGSLVSSKLIKGTVEWMGLSQPLELKKMAPAKEEDEMAGHSMAEAKKQNIAILVFDGVDVLDWAGPLEVFVNAHSFNVFTVAPVMRAYDGGNYQVTPKYTFANMPKADIVIIPGGSVAQLFHQPEVMDWIKSTSKEADITLSVCNAATLLAGANMLDGLEATTHYSWMNWLTRQSEQLNFTVVDDQRFVDNGKIVLTAGVSSGIDGALHIVARLKGLAHARMSAQMMEYNWQPDNIEQYSK
ncbi:MAG: DJ-1/PfpI family protein [Colwellia sp.]|nr:DJ-1/PfpI family protein [Colwellia sp.]